MNQIELQLMKGMIDILNYASEMYYSGNPIMDDATYDMRLEDLQQLEKETGIILSNSPTINVGAKVLTELPEVEHNHLMLSLDKCHSANEIIEFADNKDLVASVKCDGMTVSLLYEDGVFIRAESRGNGYIGNDITQHVKRFKNVPMKIDKVGTYIIDGEAVILDDDFAEVNKNNQFKNSRNLVAGTLSALDTSLVYKRKISFLGWDVIQGGKSNSLKDNLDEARTLNFDTAPYWYTGKLDKSEKLQISIDAIFEYAKDMGIPNDGIVFKFNDIEYGKSLGKTQHHFKCGIAYKKKDDVYETELLNIEWGCGKHGNLTPVAIFEPVDIDGSTISKSTVHNISILTNLDLHIGDTIEIYKANAVIPAIKRNVSADERMTLGKETDYIVIPSTCPVCGGKTEIKQDNESKVLICTNPNCKGKLLGKLTHFVSKNAMNVENLSEQTLEKFIELGWLNSFEDIYNLKHHADKMINLEGFGEKSVTKLLNSIRASKLTTLDRFIYSLSIPLIGRSASKTISKYFNGDFDSFYYECCMNKFDFKVLDDFGDSMNESINEYLEENKTMIGELSNQLYFEAQHVANNSNLEGKVFCITGSLTYFANRDEAKEKIESAGGKVSGSVSSKTDFLVCNDDKSTSSKMKKAIELGVKVISEVELAEMLK